MLLTPPEEKAIVRWIFKIEECGFPPRISHVKEAIMLVKYGEGTKKSLGKNYLTRFLDRHPDLVARLSVSFDKRRIKASRPQIIQHHYTQVQKVRNEYSIADGNIYNMDEKGFRQGVSDRARVICRRLPRGMSGKVAIDGNRELITVIETISGDGIVLPPLIIVNQDGIIKRSL